MGLINKKIVTEGAKTIANAGTKGAKKAMVSRAGRVAVGSLAGAGAGGIVGVATGADEDNMKAMVVGGAIAGGIGGAVATMGTSNLKLAGEIAGEGHVGSGNAILKHMQVKSTGELLGDIALVEERGTGQLAMDLGQYGHIDRTRINDALDTVRNTANKAKDTITDAYNSKVINDSFSSFEGTNIGLQRDGQMSFIF